jgi:hypothetical protein
MTTIKLYAYWPGEAAAGIRSGSEVITISLEHGPFEPEDVEAFQQTVREMYDCATVLTQAEQDKLEAQDREREAAMQEPETFLYIPYLRPVSFCTIPKELVWDYVEAPDITVAMRRGLPISEHRFGVISTDRQLTKEECEHYGMQPV